MPSPRAAPASAESGPAPPLLWDAAMVSRLARVCAFGRGRGLGFWLARRGGFVEEVGGVRD
uniref:Uncharacterized protein n=1 Tax=Arundo donax TaxID=35708 RepID=A0A0A9GBE7_ARUDO